MKSYFENQFHNLVISFLFFFKGDTNFASLLSMTSTPLTTLTYSSAPPYPPEPIQSLLPHEQYQELQRASNSKVSGLDEKIEKNIKKTQSVGVVGKACGAAGVVWAAAEKTIVGATIAARGTVKAITERQQLTVFQQYFESIITQGAKLLSAHQCSAMHGGNAVHGTLFVTNHSICFVAPSIRDIIPLDDVLSYLPSIALPVNDAQSPPFIVGVPSSLVLPTAVQIFTAKKQIFQFTNFEESNATLNVALKDRSIDRAINYVDHVWRERHAVPIAGVSYCPPHFA